MKRLLTNLSLLSILITGIESLNAQTNVPALITSNQVWTISGSPYLINQNTYIDSGVSVKIMPGVEVIALNTTIKLQVNGELQAVGTVDSMIDIQQLQIEVLQDATPYDHASSTGTLFRFCKISVPGVGKRGLYIYGVSTRIESCTFLNTYYAVYTYSSSQNTFKIEIIDCTFNDYTGTSFPIYTSGNNTDLHVLGNTITNLQKGGGMYLYGKSIHALGNTFDGQNSITITPYGAAVISCNTFKNLRYGLEVRFYNQDSVSTTAFTHNTLDSIGFSTWTDPMLEVYKLFNLNQSRFNNNNFLTKIGQGPKVEISGYNATPTTFDWVDLKSNYWVSTDSATIDSMIADYSDNINVFGRADFSGFLAQEDTVCEDTGASSCHASYYIAIDTADPFNIFIVNTSTGTSGATGYQWVFGDGNSTNNKKPVHEYMNFGKYVVCVILNNPAENCHSTFCDEIEVDSTNGLVLKKAAFTINVVDEADLTGIDKKESFGDLRIYPNPTGGQLIIEMNEEGDEPVHVQVFDLAGKIAFETQTEDSDTRNLSIDLSTLQEGLYLLNLQKGQRIYTTKIVISR